MRTSIKLWLLIIALPCSAQLASMPGGLLVQAPVAAGAWTPPSAAVTLEGWWDADKNAYTDLGSTLCTSNTPCEQWNDQSGKGVNAIQTTSGSRGSWYANYQNGHAAIYVNGSQWYALTMSVAAGSKSFFLAMSNSQTSVAAWAFDSQTGRLVFGVIEEAGTVGAGWFDGAHHDFTTVTTGWHTFIWVLTASGNGHVYMDGTELGAGAAYTSTAIGGTTALFSRYDGSSSTLQGTVGECGLYSGALSSGDRTSLQSYLKTKWATP